jgi:hypothetical protein
MMIDAEKTLSGLEYFFWICFVLHEIAAFLYILFLIIYESPSFVGIESWKKINSHINVIRSCRAALKKESLSLRYKHVLLENESTGMV